MNNNSSLVSNTSPARKRPDLQVNTYNPRNVEVDQRWLQFKINGKNITPRSHHVSVVHSHYLYVHGGYDVEKGSLDDFSRLDLDSDKDGFEWEVIVPFGKSSSSVNDPNYPPKLRSHSGICYKDSLIIFGGEKTINESNKNTYTYNFITKKWAKHQPNHANMPGLNAHTAALCEDKMYVFGGYITEQGKFSNQLYCLDLANFKWTHIEAPVKPKPRGSCSSVVYDKHLWMFGGTDGQNTMNDFWKFNLSTNKWESVAATDRTPEPRSDSTIVVYQDLFFLFGGIQAITKEKNDIHIYDPKANTWSKIHSSTNSIYDCSPTLKQKRTSFDKDVSPTKKGSNNGRRISLLDRSNPKREGDGSSSPNRTDLMKKIMLENKQKKFNEKKQELLKQFAMPSSASNLTKVTTTMTSTTQHAYTQSIEPRRKLSPVSENMVKTLEVIGEQENNSKLLHQEVVYDTSRRFILGKKPCARDAHTCNIVGDKMVIFGGDRHLMSFCDVYYFDLIKGVESRKLYEGTR